MKKLFFVFTIALLGTIFVNGAHAKDNAIIAHGTHGLLQDVEKARNYVEFEGLRYDMMDGYVMRVDSIVENGERFYLAEIADAYMPPFSGYPGRAVYRTHLGRLMCILDKQVAARLKPDQKIEFTAFVNGVQEIPGVYRNEAVNFKTVFAECRID